MGTANQAAAGGKTCVITPFDERRPLLPDLPEVPDA